MSITFFYCEIIVNFDNKYYNYFSIGGENVVVRLGKESVGSRVNYIFKLGLRACCLATIVFFTIVMFFCFVCGGKTFKSTDIKDDIPFLGVYVIVSESMVPTIMVNDAIVVRRVENTDLKIGDIITFCSSDRMYKGLTVTHRLIGVQETTDGAYIYRTKGDNNTSPDTALVDFKNIYGKVVLKIPKFGYVKNFVSSSGGFVISIIIPILLVIVYEVLRIKKLIKSQDEEIEII